MKLTYALFAFAALSIAEGAMFYDQSGKPYTKYAGNGKIALAKAFRRAYVPNVIPAIPKIDPKMNVWGGWRPTKRSSLVSFEGEKRNFFKHVGNFFKGALGMG